MSWYFGVKLWQYLNRHRESALIYIVRKVATTRRKKSNWNDEKKWKEIKKRKRTQVKTINDNEQNKDEMNEGNIIQYIIISVNINSNRKSVLLYVSVHSRFILHFIRFESTWMLEITAHKIYSKFLHHAILTILQL